MTAHGREAAGPVSVVLVGAGGYGREYLRVLLEQVPARAAALVAVVDPFLERSDQLPRLRERGIPAFDSLEQCTAARGPGELVVIASPIHLHVPQLCRALADGAHVLVDKPLAAVVQEADRAVARQRETGLDCRVGFQWSYSPAIQALKSDLRAGRYGRPREARALCLWPRGDAYYARNDWAGKLRAADGAWVLDGPAMNAMAHFLHNLLYLLGQEAGESAKPVAITGEAYRVNPIENHDTVACRVQTADGPEILFLASHATDAGYEPRFRILCEQAVITFGETADAIVATGASGEIHRYGSPNDAHHFQKLFEAIAAVRRPAPVLCGPVAARAHCVAVNGLQDSAGTAQPFPVEMRRRSDADGRWWIEGLDALLLRCYEEGALPAELGTPWAVAGRSVDLRDYRWFPGGRPVGA